MPSYKYFFSIVMLFALTGCANTKTNFGELLTKAPTCCTQKSQIKYQPINYNKSLSLDVGGKKSPARQFPEGKSFFLPVQLPEFSGPYELVIVSTPKGENLFIPTVQILDSSHNLVKTIPPKAFQYSNGTMQHNAFINKDEGYRYLLIYTDPKLAGNEKNMRFASSSSSTVATGDYIFNIKSGHDTNTKIKTAAGGQVEIEIRKYAPRKLK